MCSSLSYNQSAKDLSIIRLLKSCQYIFISEGEAKKINKSYYFIHTPKFKICCDCSHTIFATIVSVI